MCAKIARALCTLYMTGNVSPGTLSDMNKLTVVLAGMGLTMAGLGCEGGGADEESLQTVEGALQSPDIAPNGKGIGTMNKFQNPSGQAGKPGPANNGILYHGGPLMLGTVNVYFIWYG